MKNGLWIAGSLFMAMLTLSAQADEPVKRQQTVEADSLKGNSEQSLPTHLPLLRMVNVDLKGKLSGLDVTGSFQKPGTRFVEGKITPLEKVEPELEKVSRTWLENVVGMPEPGFELRVTSVSQVDELNPAPSAEVKPLIRLRYRRFFHGIPASLEYPVDLRNGEVESAHVFLDRLEEINDSEQPLVPQKDAAMSLRAFLKQFPEHPEFEDTDLKLEYRPTVYTNEKGVRNLCLAPFWDLAGVTFQVHAHTGKLSNND